MGKAKSAAYAYVDGSYNYNTNRYGCGGILVVNGKEYIIRKSGNEKML